MTQHQLNRAVARSTGESLGRIARIRFVPCGGSRTNEKPVHGNRIARTSGRRSRYSPRGSRLPPDQSLRGVSS